MEYLYTALLGAVPVLETRFAIPFGHLKFELPIVHAAFAGLIGNIIAIAFALWIIPKAVIFIDKRIPILQKVMQWLFEKTRVKHSKKMAIVGELFLIAFVAIPIPGSGAWTGALIAYLFDMKFKNAFLLISIGIVLSAILISFLTVAGVGIFDLLFS